MQLALFAWFSSQSWWPGHSGARGRGGVFDRVKKAFRSVPDRSSDEELENPLRSIFKRKTNLLRDLVFLPFWQKYSTLYP